jgi:general stress protein 26
VLQRLGVMAAACLLCLPTLAAPQPVPAPAPDRATIVAAAREVMEKARFCALVTLGADGQPQARVMDAFAPEQDLTVYLATKPVTRKVEQIRADPRVTLFYFDPSGPGYVTLLARAELLTDPAEKEAHWKEDWGAFYADKNRGEDFILIRCKPFRLELVSYAHGLSGDPQTWRPTTVELP